MRWHIFKATRPKEGGDGNAKPRTGEVGREVKWKKRPQDMIYAKEKKQEKEVFIVSKFFRSPVAAHGHLC
jgi:hypothetical protein